MKINEIACTLEAWRGRREELDAQLDALRLLTMAAPECPLISAIEDIWMAYTVSVSQIVGDKAEWLQWYRVPQRAIDVLREEQAETTEKGSP